MIYLRLFLAFLKIGTLSFGGGMGMISLINDECLSNGWLTEEELMNFIAVSESTPGPIAVNIATFVGSSQGGVLGALCATFGVVLPSFIIILLVASLVSGLLKYAGVHAFLVGIRPVVVGLVLATAVTMFLNVLFALKTVDSAVRFDYKALIILGVLTAVFLLIKKFVKKSPSPIVLILISAGLGVLLYGVF